ncbi:hypothetical protein HY11_17895 [Hyphomonas pacifica]|nr:hypothetical protein HY11_17895 [Hyphomonas pacifica]
MEGKNLIQHALQYVLRDLETRDFSAGSLKG